MDFFLKTNLKSLQDNPGLTINLKDKNKIQ